MSRAVPRFKRTNPPLPAVGSTNGVVVYKIVGSIEGQLTINTFYYAAAVPNPTNAQLTTLLTNISAVVWPAFRICVSLDWTVTQEKLDVVHRNDIAGVFSNANSGVFGTRGSPHMPTEVACVIIRYSAVKGQHGRGRLGLPGVAVQDCTNSVITSAVEIGNLAAFAAAYLNTASDGTNTWTPCIAQRATTSPKLIIGFSPVVRSQVKVLLGTIRRRKLGRGK